jgi:hypothetical protein
VIPRAAALAALAASALFALPAHAGTGHFFTWRHQPDFHDLQVCAERMRPLLEARAALLHVYAGSELDRFAEQNVLIAFNGVSGEEAEPFVFPGHCAPGETFQTIPTHNSVETDGKPYDEVVTASLIVARECFPAETLDIASDSSFADGWAKGKVLAEQVLGHEVKSPLSSTRARSPFSTARSPGGALASGSATAERDSARSASSPLLAVRYGALLVLAGLYVLDRRRRRAQKT